MQDDEIASLCRPCWSCLQQAECSLWFPKKPASVAGHACGIPDTTNITGCWSQDQQRRKAIRCRRYKFPETRVGQGV